MGSALQLFLDVVVRDATPSFFAAPRKECLEFQYYQGFQESRSSEISQ